MSIVNSAKKKTEYKTFKQYVENIYDILDIFKSLI